MDDQKSQMVSIIGSSYFEPIGDLIDKLTSRNQPGPNEVQAGYFENGYATSIVLLLVAMFESYVMRSRYINRENQPITRSTVVSYLEKVCPQIDSFVEIIEIFILRDLIFHNHLWEIDFSWQEEPAMVMHGAQKDPASGDNKYERFVDQTSRKTKKLELNAVPIKVDRTDVFKVFSQLWNALICLENQNRNQCYVSHLRIKFRGEITLFSDLIETVQGSLTRK